MPVSFGFNQLAALPEERITDKIARRVLSGKQGMMVWWNIKAGAHAAAHKHAHEQIVWMLKGRMDFRIGDERRSMGAGDVAVIPSGVEHEGFFPEDTEVVDIFAPPREDFLAGGAPDYMGTSNNYAAVWPTNCKSDSRNAQGLRAGAVYGAIRVLRY